MKRQFLWAVLCGLLMASAALAQNPAPKLVIASTEHNLGELKRGATATHTFTVKNEGKADLEIRNVAPS